MASDTQSDIVKRKLAFLGGFSSFLPHCGFFGKRPSSIR